MASEYATIVIHDGTIWRIDIGAPNGSTEAAQFDGLKGFPLVYGLNKLDELGYSPLGAGVVDHGSTHAAAANYTVIFKREK